MFEVCNGFIFMFLKEVSYAHQNFIYLIKIQYNCNIVKYYYNFKITVFINIF